MKKSLFIGAAITLLVVASCLKADEPPGSIRLLPGYKHKGGMSEDSLRGKIWKEGGLTIEYDIGDMAGEDGNEEHKPEYVWWREQSINNHPVRIAMTKERKLIVTFTTRSHNPANFWATVKSEEDMTDLLLMALTYNAK